MTYESLLFKELVKMEFLRIPFPKTGFTTFIIGPFIISTKRGTIMYHIHLFALNNYGMRNWVRGICLGVIMHSSVKMSICQYLQLYIIQKGQ